MALRSTIKERSAEARIIIDDIRNELSERLLHDIQSRIDAVLADAGILTKLSKFVDEQERAKVLSWVSAIEMDTVHVHHRDKAESDARQSPGAWILSNDEYLQWARADKTNSIWISSGVGTGKTVLTSTVIEARMKDRSEPVAFFYCSGTPGNDATATTAENILKCLLRQFATRSEVAFSSVATKWEESNKRGVKPLTRLEVLSLLNEIIGDELILEATILIDGFDELNTDTLRVLLDSLATLLEFKTGILKVFASSRWVQRIEDIFSKGFLIEDLASQTYGDMMIYIETAVNAQMKGRHSVEAGLVDEIKETLRERASGM